MYFHLVGNQNSFTEWNWSFLILKLSSVIRIWDFFPLSKDVVCPCCRGMTLRMMAGLALVEYLATVWWQRWLNHDHCNCKLFSFAFSLWKLFKIECEMGDTPIFIGDWFDKAAVVSTGPNALLGILKRSFSLHGLVTESPCNMMFNNSLQHVGMMDDLIT